MATPFLDFKYPRKWCGNRSQLEDQERDFIVLDFGLMDTQ